MNQRPILFVGDMHIGRRPERLLRFLEPLGVSVRDLSPAAAWDRVVKHAISVDARAVVLAGDIVDREQDLIEAYGAVESGARALVAADIPILAIAGNHDALLLPRLANDIESVRQLGEMATWERFVLSDGGPPVELIGWSFPASHHRKSPLRDVELSRLLAEPRQGARLLLIHGDLDVAGSVYAPLSSRQLRALDIDAALLGHIHRPDPVSGPHPIGYLGSLVGLDVSEPGLHGPVEVRVSEDGSILAERISLGPLRWDSIDVDVSEIAVIDAYSIWRQTERCVNVWIEEHLPTSPDVHAQGVEVLALSVRLVGGRSLERWLPIVEELKREEEAAILPNCSTVRVIIVRVDDATSPNIDVEAIAEENTPAGRLAQLLLGRIELPFDVLSDAGAVWHAAWSDENVQPPESVTASDAVSQQVYAAAKRLLEQMLDARQAEDRS